MKKGKLTQSEKRKYVRLEPRKPISVQFKVVTKAEGEKAIVSNQGATRNVSGGGMFLEMPPLKPSLLEGVLQGTHNLLLEIELPVKIKALAQVIWLEGKGKDKCGAGVSFLAIDKEDRDKLMSYIIEECLREK